AQSSHDASSHSVPVGRMLVQSVPFVPPVLLVSLPPVPLFNPLPPLLLVSVPPLPLFMPVTPPDAVPPPVLESSSSGEVFSPLQAHTPHESMSACSGLGLETSREKIGSREVLGMGECYPADTHGYFSISAKLTGYSRGSAAHLRP